MARKVGWAEAFLATGAAFLVGAIVNVLVWLIELFDEMKRLSRRGVNKGIEKVGRIEGRN